MAEEPSNWELARRLDVLQASQATMIGRPEYLADRRATENRLHELTGDILDARHDSTEAVSAISERLTAHERAAAEHRQSWRTIVYTGIIPALVVLVGILAELYLSSHGGH